MGRKSPLTEKQWAEIERRLAAGEKGRALGREFDISEAAIRKRCGAQNKQIKDVANQLVAAETAFSALPISAQISARTLADDIKETLAHIGGAARYGAATAHRLNMIANAQVEQIDETKPFDDKAINIVKGIAFYSQAANTTAEIGVKLINAAKETLKPEKEDKNLIVHEDRPSAACPE